MPWDKLLGHNRIKRILQKSIIEGRLPNAYCFYGVDGIGKDGLALEFAKTVNCSEPVRSDESIEACGHCKSCREAEKMKHPNIHFIFPLPKGKTSDSNKDSASAGLTDEQLALIREHSLAKMEDPYHRISIPGADQIRIASIREIKKKLKLSAARGGRIVVIISDFDRITPEAANAFLKTLEEPHSNVTIILTTSRVETLLPTIMSRCQQIHCESLPESLISEELQSRFKMQESEAGIIAAWAQGSFSKAVDFMDEEIRQMRSDAVDMLRTSLKGKVFRKELLEKIDNIIKNNDKQFLDNFLNTLLLWIRDAYLLNIYKDNTRIINTDQAEILSKFIDNFGHCDLEKAIAEIEKSISLIRKNVTQQLILISLFLSLRDIFLVKTN